MAITIDFNITNLYTIDLVNQPNFIKAVDYTFTGTDGVKTVTINGCVFFDPVADNALYMDYNSITNKIVKQWITEHQGDDAISAIKQNIKDIINDSGKAANKKNFPSGF